MKEEWDVCPNMIKNFKCFLIDTGKWRLEKKDTWGKWLFLIEPIGNKTAPTFGDQRNFFTGLFEAEWRNDNFIFVDGTSRGPQREKKIEMFGEIINDIKERADVKDTKRGLEFYISRSKNENTN